jgi:MFS family permease
MTEPALETNEASTEARRPPPPYAAALAGMAALAVMMGIGRFAFTPIFPMMAAESGLSVSVGGALASANYAGNLLGALSAIVVRVPAPRAIRWGLVAIGATTLAMGIERRFAVWLALRAITGFATAWVLVFVSAWSLERLAPCGRPLLTSAVFAGYGVGFTVAGGVCLVLMQSHASAADAWIILGVLALGVAGATWAIFGSATTAPGERRSPAVHHPAWTLDWIRLVLAYGAFGFGYIIPATFLPLMARQAVADPSLFGWAWPIFGLAAAGSTFAVARLSRSLGDRRLWSLGHLVLAVGVGLPAMASGIASVVVSALLVGGTFTVITMAGFQEARTIAGGRARRLIAAMVTAFGVGQIAGPVLVRYLGPASEGFSAPLVAACAVLAVSAWMLR